MDNIFPMLRAIIPVFFLTLCPIALTGCNGGGGGKGESSTANAGSLLPSRFMPEGCQACIITIEMPGAWNDGSDLRVSFSCEALPVQSADGYVNNGSLVWEKSGEVKNQLQATGEWQLLGIFEGNSMGPFSADCSGGGSGGINGFSVNEMCVSFHERTNDAEGKVLYLKGKATGGYLHLTGFDAGGALPLSGYRVSLAYQR